MSMTSPYRVSKISLAFTGAALAGISLGAASPDYPDLGRGDQLAATGSCEHETIDGISVCARNNRGEVTVVTIAPGISVVR